MVFKSSPSADAAENSEYCRETDVSVATSTATSPEAGAVERSTADSPAVKSCPRCGSTEPWGLASWCPQCGYYPSLASVVEYEPHEAPPAETTSASVAVTYLNLLRSIPPWVLTMAVGVVVIVAVSATVSNRLPEKGSERFAWTVTQATVGIVAAMVAHVVVFFAVLPRTDRYSPFDIFLKPIDIWRATFRELPDHSWRMLLAAWGITAALSALTLIGGIRYSAVFEGSQPQKRPNGAPVRRHRVTAGGAVHETVVELAPQHH